MKHRESISFVVQHVSSWTIYLLLFLTPLFFLPFTTDFFDFNKTLLVATAAVILAVCWSIQMFLHGNLRFTVAPATIPIVSFAAALCIGTFITSPNPIEVFTQGGLLILSLTLIFIFSSSLLTHMHSTRAMIAIAAGLLVMSLNSILELFKIGPSTMLAKALGVQNNFPVGSFHVAGSVIAGLSILIPVLCMLIAHLMTVKKQQERTLFGVIAGLIGVGVILHIWLLTPAKLGFPTFLPFQATREISIDMLKDTKHTLFGYGYTSFQLAFTQLRPSSINTSPLWNTRFSSARNEAFQIFITLGVVGFATWVLFLLSLIRSAFPFTTATRPVGIAILVIMLELLFIPANVSLIILLFLFALILTLIIKEHRIGKISDIVLHLFAFTIVSPTAPSQVEKQRASQVFAGICSGVLLLCIGVGMYFVVRMLIAETYMYRSLIAANKNDGAKTYALQSKAVTMAPFIDRYHASFAVTNYLIANTMASSGSLTPEDKASIPEIIQQSIREAKLAAQMNQMKVEHWETLASLYQQLIGVAQGSEQWAVAAYVKAIQLDPGNPNLRVQLGSVYMSIQNYDQALRMFQQAIELKPDWANAYYNLANAYIQKGDRKNAIENLKRTLQFLPESSAQERKAIEDQIAELIRLDQQNAKAAKPAAPKSISNDVQIRLPEDLGLPEETAPPSTAGQ